jgi:hypothetical protein
VKQAVTLSLGLGQGQASHAAFICNPAQDLAGLDLVSLQEFGV